MNIKSLHRAKSVIYHNFKLLPYKKVIFVVIFIYFSLVLMLKSTNYQSDLDNFSSAAASANEVDPDFDINDYGPDSNLMVNKTIYINVPKSKLKNILFLNDAYGVRTYDVGFGNEHFYSNMCPDTRCYTTANRSYLPSVGDFDAIVIHQRGIDWNDMPKKSKRTPKQYYIHWVAESAQYLYMDIHQLDSYFNWTMTYKRNSDFPLPYGRLWQKKQHPPLGSQELA